MTAATAIKRTERSNERQQYALAAAPFLILLVFYLTCVALVSPAGNFPLNDDWIYTQAVKTFMQTGQFVLYGCCCAACPVHVLIGAAVSAIFGFSYEALRVTSLIFGFAGTVCLYLTLRELKISKTVALISSLIYCANPIFLNIFFSYMTDGPSAAFIAMYMYAVIRGINRNSAGAFIAGGLSLMCAVAVRQTNAVFIVANFLLASIMCVRRKQSWSLFIWLVALPLITFFAADRMLTVAKTDAGYDWYKRTSSGGLLSTIMQKPWKSLCKFDALVGAAACYMGLFLAPVFLAIPRRLKASTMARIRMLGITVAVSISIVATALVQLIGRDKTMMPFSLNLLRVPSLGALPIMGINFYPLHRNASFWFTSVAAVLAVVFLSVLVAAFFKGAVMLVRYVKGIKATATIPIDSKLRTALDGKFRRVITCMFCLACTALSLSIVALQVWMGNIDRYYLIALAPCIVAAALLSRWLNTRPLLWAQIPLVLLLAAYSIAAQQDYMGWNRARWTALRSLEARGIKPGDIDGGAEYFFLHNLTWTNLRPENRGAPPRNQWRWWPATGEKYIVSFSPIPDYDLFDTQKYWSALSFSKRNVYVLKAHE